MFSSKTIAILFVLLAAVCYVQAKSYPEEQARVKRQGGCANGKIPPACCENGSASPYCCENGSTSPYCCENNSPSPYCCGNGSMNPDCS